MARTLLAKYEAIRALRAEASATSPVARLQALSTQFPGALRELDTLPIAEIERRIELLHVTAASSDAPPSWIAGMHFFHVELGALLRAKRWLGKHPHVDAILRSAFIAAHAHDDEMLRWESRLDDVAKPPRGRLSELALSEASTRAAIPQDELRRWLRYVR
ncbi:hypothetical protein BH09MYX1_BH09MYX1_49230 [soil metagenome]